MTECCEICESVDNVDEHHVSYEPEKTVPLCRSCHKKVHADKSHRLHPTDAPKSSTIKLQDDTKQSLEDAQLPKESFDETVRRLLGETRAQAWTEDEIRELVRDELETFR